MLLISFYQWRIWGSEKTQITQLVNGKVWLQNQLGSKVFSDLMIWSQKQLFWFSPVHTDILFQNPQHLNYSSRSRPNSDYQYFSKWSVQATHTRITWRVTQNAELEFSVAELDCPQGDSYVQ